MSVIQFLGETCDTSPVGLLLSSKCVKLRNELLLYRSTDQRALLLNLRGSKRGQTLEVKFLKFSRCIMLKVRSPRLETVGLDMLSKQPFGLVNQESSRACCVKPGTKSGTVCRAK